MGKIKGFTKIDNDVLEALYEANFNATQLDILLCLIRYSVDGRS